MDLCISLFEFYGTLSGCYLFQSQILHIIFNYSSFLFRGVWGGERTSRIVRDLTMGNLAEDLLSELMPKKLLLIKIRGKRFSLVSISLPMLLASPLVLEVAALFPNSQLIFIVSSFALKSSIKMTGLNQILFSISQVMGSIDTWVNKKIYFEIVWYYCFCIFSLFDCHVKKLELSFCNGVINCYISDKCKLELLTTIYMLKL